MDMNLSLRPVTQQDLDYLIWLRNTTMNPHIENSGLVVDQVAHLERINFCFDSARIIQIDGKNAGLFKVNKMQLPWDLVQIQLAPEFQGLGIGRQLIAQLLTEAKQEQASVILSVFKCNPAQKLYKSLGFQLDRELEKTFEMIWNP